MKRSGVFALVIAAAMFLFATAATHYFGSIVLGTPLATTSGGTGTVSPALTAGPGVSLSGTWPNDTVGSFAVDAVYTQTLSSSVSLSSTALTTVMSQSVTMPATGQWRLLVTYEIPVTATLSSVDAFVGSQLSDGTNIWGRANRFEYQAGSSSVTLFLMGATAFSPVYSAGQNVTVTASVGVGASGFTAQASYTQANVTYVSKMTVYVVPANA